MQQLGQEKLKHLHRQAINLIGEWEGKAVEGQETIAKIREEKSVLQEKCDSILALLNNQHLEIQQKNEFLVTKFNISLISHCV